MNQLSLKHQYKIQRQVGVFSHKKNIIPHLCLVYD